MKVYELMEQLSRLPAGARVEFRALLSLEDISKFELSEEGDYIMDFNIEEANSINDTLAVLYN